MPVSRVFLQGPFEVDFKKAWLPEAERRAAGAEARTRVSRRALGVWEPVDEARDSRASGDLRGTDAPRHGATFLADLERFVPRGPRWEAWAARAAAV